MADSKFVQLFIKLLDNKTLTLQFPIHQTLTGESIKHQIESLTRIPADIQKLTLNGKFLDNSTPIRSQSLNLSTIHLTFSLLGGKGGFGSLLRGAATKAGQKKTNNFDACRDMSGRRLRHMNAEKRLEEWKAEQEERRLEKVAEEYLKKMAKKGKGGKKEEGAEKYVQKCREESAWCVEEVERSVRESVAELLAGGKKRKLKGVGKTPEGVDAKKLKIWMGKRKLGESDGNGSHDDIDNSESDDSDTGNEKSIVDNGSQSDSSKDGSTSSLSVQNLGEDHQAGGSSGSGSEEEKETVTIFARTPNGSNGYMNGDGSVDMSLDAEEKTMYPKEKPSVLGEVVSISADIALQQDSIETDLRGNTVTGHLACTSNSKEHTLQLAATVPECYSAFAEEGVSKNSNAPEVLLPLNFDDYNSAAELEVLGLERLKLELQERGLKCGGTLRERAARLFLLKTRPVDKLPKKLLAKK